MNLPERTQPAKERSMLHVRNAWWKVWLLNGLLFASCKTAPTTRDDKEQEFKTRYAQAVMCRALCESAGMAVAAWRYADGLTGQCACGGGSISVDDEAAK